MAKNKNSLECNFYFLRLNLFLRLLFTSRNTLKSPQNKLFIAQKKKQKPQKINFENILARLFVSLKVKINSLARLYSMFCLKDIL